MSAGNFVMVHPENSDRVISLNGNQQKVLKVMTDEWKRAGCHVVVLATLRSETLISLRKGRLIECRGAYGNLGSGPYNGWGWEWRITELGKRILDQLKQRKASE